jgi:hypothetical protein
MQVNLPSKITGNDMEKKFSWKVFISFGLFFSFFIILVSGIILYLAPAGRVAHWVNWTLFGLKKEDWQALHTIFAYTFAILSIFHLFTINWKAFWSYIKIKTKQGLNRKKEFLLSLLLTLVILTGTFVEIPPFNLVMEFGEYLTESWEDADKEPPIPHAERLSISQLAAQLKDLSEEQIINKLKSRKIVFTSNNQTLTEIGILNKISPLEIYQIITSKGISGQQGTGLGNKTLRQFADETGKDINDIIKILQENNIQVKQGLTIREIATENKIAVRDIIEYIK